MWRKDEPLSDKKFLQFYFEKICEYKFKNLFIAFKKKVAEIQFINNVQIDATSDPLLIGRVRLLIVVVVIIHQVVLARRH